MGNFVPAEKLILHPVSLNRPGTWARYNNSCWEWCIWIKASQALHVCVCTGKSDLCCTQGTPKYKIWKSSRISRTPCKIWNLICFFFYTFFLFSNILLHRAPQRKISWFHPSTPQFSPSVHVIYILKTIEVSLLVAQMWLCGLLVIKAISKLSYTMPCAILDQEAYKG